MNDREILLRFNSEAIGLLEQEVKKRRELGVSNAISDTFIIRLLEATKDESKVFLFKMEKNKLIARKYSSENYEQHQ